VIKDKQSGLIRSEINEGCKSKSHSEMTEKSLVSKFMQQVYKNNKIFSKIIKLCIEFIHLIDESKEDTEVNFETFKSAYI
jgi:hypothetical protein